MVLSCLGIFHPDASGTAGRSFEDYTRPFVRSSTTDAAFCSESGTGGLLCAYLIGGFLKVVVGVSGASGAIYPLRLLERLRRKGDVEIHLIMSRSGEKTLYLETGKRSADMKALAHFSYSMEDIAAPLASGSFRVQGMVVAPCSIHTMSAIAHGISSNLLIRAADVALKERRRLILMVRESPFHTGHLRTMTALSEMGAIIAPPIPGFYSNPQTIDDLVDSSIDRVLDLLGLPDDAIKRWEGPGGKA